MINDNQNASHRITQVVESIDARVERLSRSQRRFRSLGQDSKVAASGEAIAELLLVKALLLEDKLLDEDARYPQIRWAEREFEVELLSRVLGLDQQDQALEVLFYLGSEQEQFILTPFSPDLAELEQWIGNHRQELERYLASGDRRSRLYQWTSPPDAVGVLAANALSEGK